MVHLTTSVLSILASIQLTTSFLLRTTQGQYRLESRLRALSRANITDASQYLSGSDRPWLIGSKPNNGLFLAVTNFIKESQQIVLLVNSKVLNVESSNDQFPELLGLKLSNEAVSETEINREKAGGRVDAHPVSRALYDLGCLFLDKFFDERPIERFWFLETVARVPYFAYVTVLHLYESFGWWREATLRKVHNAEEWNELHHLLIMECLGGDKYWKDRFLGYHAAFVYYWALIATYIFSPTVAYEFMALLEAHAVDTYGTFLRENGDLLKTLPAPAVAVAYYTGSDLYEFDEFQVSKPPGSRRPACNNLYDVFQNIMEDEAEHVKTMEACQEYAIKGPEKRVVSPHEMFPEATKAVVKEVTQLPLIK